MYKYNNQGNFQMWMQIGSHIIKHSMMEEDNIIEWCYHLEISKQA